MAAITDPPRWARDPRFAQLADVPPQDPKDLGVFVTASAQRYRGAITAWEILPGANTADKFQPVVDAKRMCALMTSAYGAAKSIDPANVVITGATTQVPDTPRSVSPASFIQQLYLCAKGSFDAIGMSPSTDNEVLTATFGRGGVGYTINAVHQISVLNNDSTRRIFFTGFGIPTGPSGVDDSTQATDLVTGINYLRTRDFAGTTVISELQDTDTGSSNPADNLGLTRSDGSVKPSLRAVITMRG